MEHEVQGKEQLRLLRTPFGLEQRAAYVQLDRIHEELDECLLLPSAFAPVLVAAGGRSHRHRLAAAGERGTAQAGETATTGAAATTAAEAEAETAVSTVLIVGDQNAGKTSFLFCFSRNLFLQQLQLSSFLPLLRASFVNARLIFISSQQLLRMQQAATTIQQQRSAGAVEKATVGIHSAATATASAEETAAATPAGATNAAAICDPAEEVPAAAAAAARMAATATCTMGSNDINAGAGHGDEGAAGGSGRSSRSTNGEESSEVGERRTSKIEEDALLRIARDELPFLDSDVARALVLFTLEDFLFLCEELDVHCSCWSRGGNKISSTLETSSSSCNQGSKQKASAAACPEFLHAAGIRYVAVHLLEFGGDHLDRLLRFIQLTSRGQLSCGCKGNSSNSNMSSSAKSSPTTSSCVDDYSSNSRDSSGGRHTCSSRVSNSNARDAHKFDSSPSGTGVSSSRSITCCATELLHGGTATGRDSAAEHAVAIEAAKQILKEEQQRFQQTLVAKAEQEQLAARAEPDAALAFACATAASATPPSLGPSASAHAVPPVLAAHAPGTAKFAFAAAPAPAPAAAPAFSCAEEASSNTRSRQRIFSREAAAAAGHQDETETVGHTRTSTAAVPAAKDTPDPEAQSGVYHAAPTTRGRQKDVEEGDGGMPPPSDPAEGLHKPRRNDLCAPATDPGKSGASEDAAEEQSSQSLQLLQVLRRSAQLLSEATHTLYFVNCSSLMPHSPRCTRPCCRDSAVCTERCFALDPTAFAAFVGRLYTLALVQQRSVGRSSGGRDRHDSNVENSGSRKHRDTCINSSSNGSGSNHSCSSAAEPPFRERQPISFVCCRLPEPQPHFSSASNVYTVDPDAAASDAGVAAAAAEEGGEVSAKQLLERCCSCCVRENFDTAVQLLRTTHTEQQQQQRYGPPSPAKQQQWFSAAEVVVAEAGAATSVAEAGMVASAPRARDRRAASAGPVAATKEAPALSYIPELAKMKSETGTAQPVLPGARRGGVAALADEDRHLSAEKEDPRGCHHSVGAAAAVNHEPEASEFRLFMQLLQEAAASAVAAATSAGAEEAEEELVAAATEEAALRGSPRFLFVRALLHFMWLWHVADESDAGAEQTAAMGAAMVGLPTAGGTPVATAAESTEEAVTEAATPFLNDDGGVAHAAHEYVSAQLVPETNVPAGASAARGEAAGRREATGEALVGVVGAGIGALPSRGTCAAADRHVDVGDPAEHGRHTERGKQQEGNRRRPALTSVKAQLLLSGHEPEGEAAERFPPQLQQPRARCPSQMTVICSTLQLQAVNPMQLFQQRQRQQEQQAPVRRVSEQQQHQLETVEKGQLLPPSQQQAEEGQWLEQRGQDTWAQQQQNRRALDQTEQREMPMLNGKEQHQQRERDHADELDEQQKEDALLQPPFRVGAVVNLFATLLRLGLMPQQKEPPLSPQSLPAEAYIEEEPTALGGTSTAVAAGVRAALSPTAGQGQKKSRRAALFFDEHRKTTADPGSPSPLAARTATAAAAAEEADKEKGNREAFRSTAGGKAMVAPTGELGRQLLLTFLQLARKQRHFVRLSTGFAEDAGETEPADREPRVPAAGSPLAPGTAVLDIWFSPLDAVLLLNDEEEGGCFSGEACAVVEQRSGHRSRRSSRAFEATAAAAAPLAKSFPAAGSSTGTPFLAAEAVARPAQASAAPAADATAAFPEAQDIFPRTAADVQEVCASFERLHVQLEQTVIAEEASFLPASTFIQLLPTLLAGLVEIGAASPYDASAAPFPPVLLELRWLQESPSASTAAVPIPPPTATGSSPSSVPSFLAVAPREATKTFPGSAGCHVLRFGAEAAQEPEPCHFAPDSAPAAKAAGAEETESAVAASMTAKAKEELHAPERVAFRVTKTAYGQPTTFLSTVSTSTPEGDGFDGTIDAAPSSAADHPAAEEAQRSETSTATVADYSTTSCTVAAPAAAAVSPPKGRNVSRRSAPAVTSGQCVKMLLAPAGLLQQKRCIHHTESGAAPASTSERQTDGSEAAAGETEDRAAVVKGRTAPSAARRSGERGASCGATAAAEETAARGGSPVRMALQEQLFNFVYCSLQEAAWAGPLPTGFWRRETSVCWESCGICNSDAESVCCSRNNENRPTGSSTTSELINRNFLCTCTSLGTSNTARGSSNSSRSCARITAGQTCACPVAVETPWLDCVEQCVLQALYAQVQALCTGLHKYSNGVAEEICSCSADGGAAARPVATAGDSQRLPEKTPAGVPGVAVLEPPQLQHVDVQLKQHAEKQEAKARRQQSGGGSRQVDQDVSSSRSVSRHRETPSLDWQPTYNLAAAEGVAQTASAITEIAATAHVLLQLAGDMALLARMKSCTPHGEAARCYFDGCSGDENGTLKGGDASAEETPPAGSTMVPRAGQTASNVKAHMSEFTSEQAATAMGAEGTHAHHAAAGAAGSTPIGAGAVNMSVRSRFKSHCRGLEEKTRVTSGSATGSVRWWVEDQTCSPGNVPCRKIVVEVLSRRCSSVLGNSSSESSDTVAHVFSVCGSSASHDVCTPQKQAEVLATLAHLLRCPRSLQHQQEQERKQHSQQGRNQQHINYLSNSRKGMTRRSSICGEEEEEAVAEQETPDPSEVFYLRGDKLSANSDDAAAAAARTETVSCWRKLLCQLEDENISLSFL